MQNIKVSAFIWHKKPLPARLESHSCAIEVQRREMTPSIDVAAKIADALNVTVDYLIGQSDHLIMDKNLVLLSSL
jgi:hypothetical protein